jgi:hypothetical protein
MWVMGKNRERKRERKKGESLNRREGMRRKTECSLDRKMATGESAHHFTPEAAAAEKLLLLLLLTFYESSNLVTDISKSTG